METLYINIGTENCCFFAPISISLIKTLEKYPLLYDAIEESIKCAQLGFFSVGILTFSQLLNVLKEKTPEERHKVAHEILNYRPSQETYDSIVTSFNNAAEKIQQKELLRHMNFEDYKSTIQQKWKEFMKKCHNHSM